MTGCEPRPTVLIVDDSPTNIGVLNHALAADYRILFATRGQEALDLAATQKPDLILLDITMPDMDGYQVCARLKEAPATRGIPVIFVTARDQARDEEIGLEVGAVDYLTKPIRPTIVRLRVRNHLELKWHRDRLEHLSMMDGLTGIANRRHFDTRFEQDWQRGQSATLPLSLVLIDLDHFKLYNDLLGHMAGDDCLRRVSALLAETCGDHPTALVARYGGEEFACLLPDTDLAAARRISVGINDRLRAAAIPHQGSTTAGRVTVSQGIATRIPTPYEPRGVLLEAADRALYRAKAAGRNRIATDDGDAETTDAAPALTERSTPEDTQGMTR